ncbi:MAG: endolytic transglycosylase MltG [Bryobacteraceae bacterium]
MKRIAAVVLLLVLAAAAYAAWTLTRPYAAFSEPILVDIPTGTSTRAMASILAGKGVLRDPATFLLLRALRPTAKLQAGEYEFKAAASPMEIYSRLARGDVHFYEFTVPEGSNLFDTAQILSQLGFFTAEQFVAAARDPALIRDLAPQATSLEGYLFPSTYHVTRGTTALQICRRMTGEFRKAWKRIGSAAPVHEVVTLASLIEKETGVAEERPIVSSVYRNRLARGIKLECDPTTIYAAILENRYRGKIYRSDLDSTHPYNTYQHPGLPPGPIANPGEASLRAAVHPAESDYLFFVARPDGSGGHNFSVTLSDHNRAVTEYRRGEQKKTNQTQSARRPARRG